MIALVIVLNTLLSVAMTSVFYIWSSLSLKAWFDLGPQQQDRRIFSSSSDEKLEKASDYFQGKMGFSCQWLA